MCRLRPEKICKLNGEVVIEFTLESVFISSCSWDSFILNLENNIYIKVKKGSQFFQCKNHEKYFLRKIKVYTLVLFDILI